MRIKPQTDEFAIGLSFVHFGPSIPKYLALNIQRTLFLFPSIKVAIAVDSDRAKKQLDSFKRENLVVVMVENRSELPQLSHDQRFWSGWWQKTMDRLIVLDSLHESLGTKSMLHVESDVVLMPSFPFEWFTTLPKYAWAHHGGEADIASLVFSANLASTKHLVESLVHLISRDPTLTDMTALRRFREREEESVEVLDQSVEFATKLNKEGVFDGADFGNWICGKDPKSNFGISVKRLTPFNSKRESFEKLQFWLEGEQVFISTGDAEYCLNNLHVHSKELQYFRLSNRKTEIRHEIVVPRFSLHISALFFWIVSKTRIYATSLVNPAAWRRLAKRFFK
jgi:hypothetical protein